MNTSKKHLKIVLLIAGLLLAGCAPTPPPDVEIFHTPVIAQSTEKVTFTATVLDDGIGPVEVQILVNAAVVQTCSNLSTGDTCTYSGGPYSAYEGRTISYLANAKDSQNKTDSKGYYYFAVTDSSYNWSKLPKLNYMPARYVDAHAKQEDLVFHRASDYTSFGDFVDDVEDKMYGVYADQDIIELPTNYDDFNFYMYSKVAADTIECGTVHSDANTEMPWRNVDAILHTADFGDVQVSLKPASPRKGITLRLSCTKAVTAYLA